MTKETGGPAFPQPITSSIDGHTFTTCDRDNAQSGMTLRDWFAGMALQGAMSGSLERLLDSGASPSAIERALVKTSYEMADAMIKARNSGEQQ